MSRSSLAAVSLVAMVFAVVPVLSAQTTGDLIGKVADGSDQPLAGARVEVTSPSLIGGPRISLTDELGRIAFSGLAVGTYEIRVALDRFAPQHLTGVEVRVKRTSQVHVQLSPSTVEGRITVTSSRPTIDPVQVSQGQVLEAEYLKKTAIGFHQRDYLNVIKQSPGVVDEILCGSSIDPSVFGSLENENVYLIDGVSSNLPGNMTWGALVPFDAIKQISLETAGYEAEYGATTGGVISLVTKSGGNRFSGSADIRQDSSDWFENGDHFDPDREPFRARKVSATLGGPIQKDRLWFFAAAESYDSEFDPYLAGATWDFEGYSALGKLTWQATERWSLVGQFLDNPVTVHNDNADQWVRPAATRKWEQGGPIARTELSGVLTNRLTWNLRGSYWGGDISVSPEDDSYDGYGHFDCSPIDDFVCRMAETAYAEGTWDLDRRRKAIETDLLLLASPKHSLKFGLGYARESWNERQSSLSAFSYYSFFGNTAWLEYVPPVVSAFDYDGDHLGAFVQDSWRIRPRVSAKVGLRWDEATQENDLGDRVSRFSELHPRLGLAWQITEDGKTVGRVSWGRYLRPDSLRLGIMARQQLYPPTFWYLPCGGSGMTLEECREQNSGSTTLQGFSVDNWIEDPEGLEPSGFWLVDSQPAPADEMLINPGLEPMYADQLVVAVEREVAPRTSLELSYVEKAARDIFEDTCSGNYPSPSEEAACEQFIIANLPGLRRDPQSYGKTYGVPACVLDRERDLDALASVSPLAALSD